MPVTGNEILAYQGDANSAAATGGGPWGVMQTPELSQAARDLTLLNVQRNKDLWQQRIKDRDTTYQKIDSDELILKDVLDVDRDRLQKKVQEFQDTFYKNGGDIMSDPKKYREFVSRYQSAVADIKQSQKRRLGVEADMLLLKQTKNSAEQGRIKQHIQQQLAKSNEDFYKVYEPYAPFATFDATKMGLDAVYGEGKTSWVHDPKFGNIKVDEKTLDENALRANIQKAYMNDDTRDMFTNERGSGMLDHLTPDYIQKINEGLARYNKESGKTIAPVQAGDSPVDIAWKMTLAQSPYKTVTKAADATVNAHEDNEKDRSVQWYNAESSRISANASALNAKTNAEQEKRLAQQLTASGFYTPGNILDNINTDSVHIAGGDATKATPGKWLNNGKPVSIKNGVIYDADGKELNTGRNMIRVPKSALGTEILAEYNKAVGSIVGEDGTKVANDPIEGEGDYVRVLVDGGKIMGIQTKSGAIASRNYFEHITQQAELKGVTKQKPATNLGKDNSDPLGIR